MAATNYPGFNFDTVQLSAFILSIDTFIISLKDGSVIHYTPDNIADFRAWLAQNGVRDISVDKGYGPLNPKL